MHRLMSQLVLLAVAIASTGQPIAAGEAMDLPTLIAALRSQLSSIGSVEVKYQMVSDTPEGRQEIEDDEWAEQGECLAFTRFLRQSKRNPESTLFDGAKGYFYVWAPSGDRAPRLTVSDAVSPAYWNNISPAQFMGRRIGEMAMTLAELMSVPTAHLIGPETFGGSNCWRVEIRGFEGRGKRLMRVSALLDEDHDYLPVAITLRPVDDGLENADEPYRNKTFRTWTTNEFMRVTDAASGAERWFPKTMLLDTLFGLKYRLTVSAVAINETLPVERFRPNSPDGTLVYDAKRGPNYQIQGGGRATDSLTQRAADDALGELRARGGSPEFAIDARPGRRFAAPYVIFGCSVLMCGLAAFLWFRVSKT